MTRRGVPGIVSAAELTETVAAIASLQLPNGMIPWFPGGHADPWNHVEAAMALSLGSRRAEAERAYEWLMATQHVEGSWCAYTNSDGTIEDAKRDTNVCSYIAVGVWFHYLCTGDRGFLEAVWPTVDRALSFVLGHQQPGGEITWMEEADGTPGAYALLTGSSSVLLSLRCAIAASEHMGIERPDWELAAGRLRHALAYEEHRFEPKRRWAMDWYYPVLGGALHGEAARARMQERWDEFVMPDRGVRCVADEEWVTTAETCECVMALDAAGLRPQALELFSWAQAYRDTDGSYWTGTVFPSGEHYPGEERSSYTSASVVLAANVLVGDGPTAGLFRGEHLPRAWDLDLEDDATLRDRRP